MINSNINNWSNLPPNIIFNIGRYTYKYFLPNLRLINKHWSSATNPLFFYSISNFHPDELNFIVSKYAKLIGMIDSFDTKDSESIKMIVERSKCIDEIKWWVGKESYLDRLLDFLKTRKDVRSIVIADDDEYDSEYAGSIKWFSLIDILKDYPSLEAMCINIRCTYLLPLMHSLPLLTIKKLELKIDSNQFESSVEIIRKCDKLKHLKLEVKGVHSENDDIKLFNLVSPNRLVGKSLEHFHFKMYYNINIDREAFKESLSSELFNIFSNANFSNLKHFNIDFVYWDPSSYVSIFIEPLLCISPQWTKLTKLSLFSIDEFLLGHIINHCPNLCLLAFKSPLVLPYNHDLGTLKPLKYLTKLSFCGFQSDILNHKEFIRNLFPSVATLSLDDLYFKPDNIEIEPYYIPNLFPNLAKLILEGIEYNLEKLINSWQEDLTWEEFYILLNKPNEKLLKSLIPKLTKLRNLYINDRCISSFNLRNLNLNSATFKVFIADSNDDNVFDFIIENELVQI